MCRGCHVRRSLDRQSSAELRSSSIVMSSQMLPVHEQGSMLRSCSGMNLSPTYLSRCLISATWEQHYMSDICPADSTERWDNGFYCARTNSLRSRQPIVRYMPVSAVLHDQMKTSDRVGRFILCVIRRKHIVGACFFTARMWLIIWTLQPATDNRWIWCFSYCPRPRHMFAWTPFWVMAVLSWMPKWYTREKYQLSLFSETGRWLWIQINPTLFCLLVL